MTPDVSLGGPRVLSTRHLCGQGPHGQSLALLSRSRGWGCRGGPRRSQGLSDTCKPPSFLRGSPWVGRSWKEPAVSLSLDALSSVPFEPLSGHAGSDAPPPRGHSPRPPPVTPLTIGLPPCARDYPYAICRLRWVLVASQAVGDPVPKPHLSPASSERFRDPQST